MLLIYMYIIIICRGGGVNGREGGKSRRVRDQEGGRRGSVKL